jgi:integrase/recombinase XerD
MSESNRIFMPDFTGPIAGPLRGFLEEKRALGYKYSSESWRLLQIDRLSKELDIAPNTLPKELIDAWSLRTPTESTKTWHGRITVINQLTNYFVAHDLPCVKTDISYEGPFGKSAFIPHIFTVDEMKRIFHAADNLNAPLSSIYRRDVAALLFRMLYSCGLRLNEALSLTIDDVDIENSVLTIKGGKGKVDRYVPMSQQLSNRCAAYKKSILAKANPSSIFFSSPDGGKYAHSTVTYMWNQILHSACISKNDDGPRIHDLRHTFAVHCLKKWVDNGEQINALLPVLSSYMGHVNLASVNNYLRLTADVFPDITHRVESYFGHMIPNGGHVYEEE